LAEEVKDRGGRLHLSGERRNPRFENFQPQLSRSPMNLVNDKPRRPISFSIHGRASYKLAFPAHEPGK
jgi:hypothetical protein